MIPQWKAVGIVAGHRLGRLALDGAWVWIALPLAIIYVLGVSMQGLFSAEFTPASPYRVAVAAPGDTGAPVVEALLANPRLFAVETVAGEDAARAAVVGRKSDVAVIVPPEGAGLPARVIGTPGSVALEVVGSVVREAVAAGEAGSGAARDGGAIAATSTGDETVAAMAAGDEAIVGPARGNAATAGDAGGAETPAVAAEPGEGEASLPQPSSFGYFSVGITIMFLMFTVHSAMSYIVRDRSSGAYGRIRALGVSRTAYLVAGYSAALGVGVIFAGAMALATKVAFGVAWGDPLAWAALTLASAAGVASISFLIVAMLPPTPKAVDNAGSTLFIILAMMGGSTVPVSVLPGWFVDAFAWLPNRIALDGYFAIAAGGGLADVASNIWQLLAAAAFLLAAGWSASALRAKGEA